MNTLREAAQQALEALETRGEHHPRVYRAIEALRAALAEPVLERNFCPRCGKRSFPDTIHTCTPPHGIGEQK